MPVPSFVCFWCARVMSTLAYQMFGVAVAWQLYELTGSALALGMIGLVQFVPTVSLVLFTGHVADRLDRRLVGGTCQTLQGLATCAIVLAIVFHAVDPAWLFAISFVMAAARAFESPAVTSLLPNLVSREELQSSVSKSTSAIKLAQLAGPALGGILYAVSPAAVYATLAALLFAAAVLIQFCRPRRQTIERTPMTLNTLLAGVRYVVNDRIILGAVSLDLFAVIMGGATALLPIYARDILDTGAWGLGLLRAAPAVGAILMTILLARLPLRRRVGPAMFASVSAFGVATVAFAVSHSFVVSFLMLAASGLFDTVSVVIRQTLVQIETPDAVRGRVTAVNLVFANSSGTLGQVESGLVAAWLGAVPSAIIGGIGSIVVAVAWMGLFPEMLRIDSLENRSSVQESPLRREKVASVRRIGE
jgi:MFS family permease